MVPRNGTTSMAPCCHVQSAKVVRRPPPLLEVRTPIAIAIWGIKKNTRLSIFNWNFAKELWPTTSRFSVIIITVYGNIHHRKLGFHASFSRVYDLWTQTQQNPLAYPTNHQPNDAGASMYSSSDSCYNVSPVSLACSFGIELEKNMHREQLERCCCFILQVSTTAPHFFKIKLWNRWLSKGMAF